MNNSEFENPSDKTTESVEKRIVVCENKTEKKDYKTWEDRKKFLKKKNTKKIYNCAFAGDLASMDQRYSFIGI